METRTAVGSVGMAAATVPVLLIVCGLCRVVIILVLFVFFAIVVASSMSTTVFALLLILVLVRAFVPIFGLLINATTLGLFLAHEFIVHRVGRPTHPAVAFRFGVGFFGQTQAKRHGFGLRVSVRFSYDFRTRQRRLVRGRCCVATSIVSIHPLKHSTCTIYPSVCK